MTMSVPKTVMKPDGCILAITLAGIPSILYYFDGLVEAREVVEAAFQSDRMLFLEAFHSDEFSCSAFMVTLGPGMMFSFLTVEEFRQRAREMKYATMLQQQGGGRK